MSFWEDAFKKELQQAHWAELEQRQDRRLGILRTLVVPDWVVAADAGAAKGISPTIAHFLVRVMTDVRGLAPERIHRGCVLIPRIQKTFVPASGGPSVGLYREELQRLLLVLDASARTFLAWVYEAEGDVGAAGGLRRLPPAYTLKDFYTLTRALVTLMEAEHVNGARRPVLASLAFVETTREIARGFMRFDRALSGLRKERKIPLWLLGDVVSIVFGVYARARRCPQGEEILDEYVLSLIDQLVKPGAHILPVHELNVPGLT